ncbi:hypothetical protein FA95DRAFT_1564669 [Auriscalpium vulgare]|uniref:Uncharacterized protein n=1 Tax=Auriscalpium vulgare TaxID=40419 RepID=A0ACB8RE10_9AGAM|nr:hypothetical protein FA95DRAFT_1564669 [Auriscalpium vulgare]
MCHAYVLASSVSPVDLVHPSDPELLRFRLHLYGASIASHPNTSRYTEQACPLGVLPPRCRSGSRSRTRALVYPTGGGPGAQETLHALRTAAMEGALDRENRTHIMRHMCLLSPLID